MNHTEVGSSGKIMVFEKYGVKTSAKDFFLQRADKNPGNGDTWQTS